MVDDELLIHDSVLQTRQLAREVFAWTAVSGEEIGCTVKLAQEALDGPHVDGSQ